MIGGYPNKNPTIMKKFFSLALLLAIVGISVAQEKALNPYQGYHQLTRFDSTSVKVEESGLSHIVSHRRIAMLDRMGCKSNSVIKLDYDPLSAYVEFLQVMVVRADGHTDTLFDSRRSSELNVPVYDYIAPARLIYWGASQKMIEVGHLEPNDELEYTTYKKGYSYALLADGAQGGSLTQGGLSACFDAVPHDDTRYVPPMRGHFYDIVPFWSTNPVNQKVYSVNVLTEKNLRFAIYNCKAGDVKVDSTIDGDRTIYTFAKSHITPLVHEPSALADNDMQPKLLLSTSPNWQAKSIWFYGVNEDYGSFKPTAEVQAKVNELLRDASTESDSISILTHWVADNIRYAGISMGEGEGYTLHNAEMNFTDRCGVCKDKAGMLVTMLRAAGFNAYAAMTMAHERIDPIPADQFNHSVCAVQHRNGKFEMLDPTWVPNVRELWSSAEQQQGYLMGLPEGADLMYTPLSAPENHYVRINGTSTIQDNGDLVGTITITAEGQSDRSVRGVFNCRTAEWRRNLEIELLKINPNAIISGITHTDNDDYLLQPVSITYRYIIPGYATIDADHLAFIPLSARNFYSRAMSHLYFDVTPETRTQPFSDACSRLVEIKEVVTLPAKYKKLNFPTIHGVSDPAASFGCQYWMEDNTLTFAESVVLGKRVYNPEDWPAFRQTVANQKTLATTPVILSK